MKHIVISAPNLVEAGGLVVLRGFLKALHEQARADLKVSVFVNSNISMPLDFPNFIFKKINFPKKSWFGRIFFEYVYCYIYSLRQDISLWVSLHDTSPIVRTNTQVVYCHNPAPFYNSSYKDLLFDPKFYFFSKFYKYLYRINLSANKHIIVQQNWIKTEFMRVISKNIVPLTARPEIDRDREKEIVCADFGVVNPDWGENYIFYPSFARIFKNFETICDAVVLLNQSSDARFSLVLTISAEDNRYSKYLVNKYSHYNFIFFIGNVSHERSLEIMRNASALAFPSKLETFGLPLIEARQFNIPVVASDLPYAHETCGVYPLVRYVGAEDVDGWVESLRSCITEHCAKLGQTVSRGGVNGNVDFPSWASLCSFLLSDCLE